MTRKDAPRQARRGATIMLLASVVYGSTPTTSRGPTRVILARAGREPSDLGDPDRRSFRSCPLSDSWRSRRSPADPNSLEIGAQYDPRAPARSRRRQCRPGPRTVGDPFEMMGAICLPGRDATVHAWEASDGIGVCVVLYNRSADDVVYRQKSRCAIAFRATLQFASVWATRV